MRESSDLDSSWPKGLCYVVCTGLNLNPKMNQGCFPLEIDALEFITPSVFFCAPFFFIPILFPSTIFFPFHLLLLPFKPVSEPKQFACIQEGSAIRAALSLLLVRIYLAIIFVGYFLFIFSPSFLFFCCSVAFKSRCQEQQVKV